MIQFRIAWLWVKKNWKASALVAWSVFVWFISRKNSQGAIDVMNANKESYDTQIKSLKAQHKVEVKKREELHLKYQETLAKIEEKYNKKEEDLSRKQKEKVKEIVKQAKERPNEINKKIENLFGFTSDT